ncbi:unnamed protein product [Acanthoscelides obtectus]|uniref:C2H2-type domain-containing protein n=1 Tax=Acanthoscelides obtectus TaxID=200917 RepID=A0A9P0M9M4_ACAOB|nr:unnamed protein product [Acanthoscelides obtectus]CAH2014405.1 unnamed protein product [Acanthoscelides obtectus]CAK1676183.1 Zinc finger protein 84 [Acanthoscelides obtectus]CAK1676194.1 Zinc finger protein 84 [Acanthoscelides obtectus]
MKHSGIKLPCTKCNELFTSKRSLDHHTSRNHPVSDKIHECTHCEYKTTYARNLTTHTTRHHGAKLTCTKCDVSFALKMSLDNHILQMHPESAASVSHKIYECTHCEYKTTHPGSLPRHLMKHTGAKIKCANCDASFAHKSSLEDHILQKHPEFATALSHKLRKCTQCEYETVHRKTFNRHMMIHTGNKFPCPNCDVSFTSKISLDNHILKKHPEFTASLSCKIYKCTQCQYKTTYRADLPRHVIKHTGNKCTKCDESFTTRQSLNNHILQKHPEFTALVSQKIHKCTYCQYKTTYAKHLVEHMMSHTAKLMCAKCDASFKTKIWLDNHILQKHPECTASVSFKIHKCTRCEYKTTQTRSLADHMTKHTGIKLPLTKKRPAFTASVPRKVHKCTLCQYRTTYKSLLTIHMMKHTGARLTCTKCDATFTNKQLLDNHILQKHPEFHASVSHKIHKCTSCQYKTTYTRYLDRHMMKHSAKLACTKCDATFTSKQWFENHMLQKHPEVTIAVSHKIHKCTDCEYKSLQKHQLTMHMMKHTGAKLTCPKCDASYLTKHTLDNHIVQNHPEVITYVSRKIHECTYCEYKSVQKLQLTVHMMKHTGDKFTCTKCDASFTFKRSLDNHIIQKHPESAGSLSRKIHKCTHCDYKTIHAQRMTKHKAKHMTKRKAKHNNTKRDGFT